MADGGLTKLQAINKIALALQRQPFSALTSSGTWPALTYGTDDSALYERYLDLESKRIQTQGWETNTVRYKKYKPTIVSGAITSNTAASPTVFLVGSTTGLTTGDVIILFGTNCSPNMDGPQTITVVDATHFSVAVNVTTAGTSGYFKKGTISFASTVVGVQPAGFNENRRIQMRAGNAYDLDNDGYGTFSDESYLFHVKTILDFADCSPELKEHICDAATRYCQIHMKGDLQIDQTLAEQESRSSIAAQPVRTNYREINDKSNAQPIIPQLGRSAPQS